MGALASFNMGMTPGDRRRATAEEGRYGKVH